MTLEEGIIALMKSAGRKNVRDMARTLIRTSINLCIQSGLSRSETMTYLENMVIQEGTTP